MFSITDAAGEYLTAVLDHANASEATAIRFVLEGTTLTPTLDRAHPGDVTFAHGDRTVVVLEAHVSDTLSEATLAVEPTADGPQLVLQC